MLKETITFTNFDGKQVTETHYFNLTRAELVQWEMEHNEGVAEYFLRISQSNNKPELGQAFHDFLRRTYGLKSEDGNRHMKSEEISENFEHSAAFDEFYIKLITDEGFAGRFIKGVLPKEWLKDGAVEQIMATGDERLRAVADTVAGQSVLPPPPSAPGLASNPAGA